MRSYQVVEFGHTLRGAAPRSHALPARSRGRSGRSAKDGLPPYRGSPAKVCPPFLGRSLFAQRLSKRFAPASLVVPRRPLARAKRRSPSASAPPCVDALLASRFLSLKDFLAVAVKDAQFDRFGRPRGH
jgi:hypothetical protein